MTYREFGPLYHGTPHGIEGEHLDPERTSPLTMRIHRAFLGTAHPGVFASTDPGVAAQYAEGGYLHEVEPHPDDESFEVDQLGSDSDTGSVSLRFNGRVLSKRQFDLSKGEWP